MTGPEATAVAICVTCLIALIGAIWNTRGRFDRIEANANLQFSQLMGETKLQTVKIDHIGDGQKKLTDAFSAHEDEDARAFSTVTGEQKTLELKVARYERSVERLERESDDRSRSRRSFSPYPGEKK